MQEILSKKKIGERIKNLRLESKLSQAFVAEKLKISRSNYSQIELGNQFMSFNSLYLVSNLYGKSYEWLLQGAESTTESNHQEPMLASNAIKDMQRTLEKFKYIVKELELELNRIERHMVDENVHDLNSQ